jgi:precorrin-6x reductase
MSPHVLILGGTTEARDLAGGLADRPNLAGRGDHLHGGSG